MASGRKKKKERKKEIGQFDKARSFSFFFFKVCEYRKKKRGEKKKAPNKGKTGIYGLYGKEATNTCMNLGCKKKKKKRSRQQVEAILFP